MLLFWILAALVASGATALVLAGAAWAPRVSGRDQTLALHRRALEEIDRLSERSLIAPEERRVARAEAARRLIRAADEVDQVPERAGSRLVAAGAVATVLAALALYLAIGSPGARDAPFAGRLAEWRAHPERYGGLEMAAALRSLAAERPSDPEPLRRLAGLDIAIGDPDGAVHSLRQALTIAPDRPDLMAPLGEILVLRAGGTVGPDAQAVFLRLLRLDPASDTARYYLARGKIAAGDTAGGLDEWRVLLAGLALEDPRRRLLLADIDTVERTGALPAAQPTQPSENVDTAIRGMVEGLALRLQAHPDNPDGWVRLVRAYGVLGDLRRRDAVLARARLRYARQPTVLAKLAAASSPPS